MLPVATWAEAVLEERNARSTRTTPPRRRCTKNVPAIHTSEQAPARRSGLGLRLNFGGDATIGTGSRQQKTIINIPSIEANRWRLDYRFCRCVEAVPVLLSTAVQTDASGPRAANPEHERKP